VQLKNWKVLGKDNLTGVLRSDFKKAKDEIIILGPWIDEYFASLVVESCPQNIIIRIVSRPFDTMEKHFVKYANSAYNLFSKLSKTDFRFHSTLHAKVIIIDNSIVYCGSANWYKYSMEKSEEIVLRGSISSIPNIMDEVASIWEQSDTKMISITAYEKTNKTEEVNGNGFDQEILDPIAAKKLKEVKNAFIIKKITK